MKKKFRIEMVTFLIIGIASLMNQSSHADATAQKTMSFPDKFPPFSWDTVPIYKMFGDTAGLKDDEVQFIASTSDFVCLEKGHGRKKHGAAEIGQKIDIKKLKAANPKIKALMYFNASILWPNTTYVRELFDLTETDNPYQASLKTEYADFSLLKNNEPYFKGTENSHYFFVNIANPNYQKWWIDSATKGINFTGADGIFIDAFWIPGYLMKSNNLTDEDQHDAVDKILTELKEKIGPEKIILINTSGTSGPKFTHGDGFMFENYDAKNLTTKKIISHWEIMKTIHDAGKFSVWRIGVNATGDFEEQDEKVSRQEWEERSKELATFWTAAFLIGAQEYSYFQYGWGFQLKDGGALVDYPEFRKALGPPKGEYWNPRDLIFARRFQHADVAVDLETRTSKIIWHK
jgi:hypothetical protein